MTTLLTRIFRARAFPCTRCQVGQGRLCQCEGAARCSDGQRRALPTRRVGFRWPRVSDTAWMWLLIVGNVACLVLFFRGLAAAWKAWA